VRLAWMIASNMASVPIANFATLCGLVGERTSQS
jgi:hypothetical protein